jgi:peptidylprolyl isomerase
MTIYLPDRAGSRRTIKAIFPGNSTNKKRGTAPMQQATPGNSVTIVYEGLLANGEKFESSEDTGPLSFLLGSGSVLPAFEQAVIDMVPGGRKTITVPAAEAHGAQRPELILTLARNAFADKEIAVGMVLGMTMEREGQQHSVPATVLAVDSTSVTIDFNHPLAGQDLTYQITLLSINSEPAAMQTTAGDCACSGSDKKSACTPGNGCCCA